MRGSAALARALLMYPGGQELENSQCAASPWLVDAEYKGLLLVEFAAFAACFPAIYVLMASHYIPMVEFFSDKIGIPKYVAGATLLAVSNSLTEFFVNLMSAMVGRVDMGYGEIMGSICWDFLMVLGFDSVINQAKLPTIMYFSFLGWYMICGGLSAAVLVEPGFTFPISIVMVFLFVVYMVYMIVMGKMIERSGEVTPLIPQRKPVSLIGDNLFLQKLSSWLCDPWEWVYSRLVFPHKGDWRRLPISILCCWFHVVFLCWVIVATSNRLICFTGVGEEAVGAALMPFFTGFNDLVASAIAAAKGEGPLAVCATMGTVVCNSLMGLGIPWLLFGLMNKDNVVVPFDELSQAIFESGLALFSCVFTFVSLAMLNLQMTKKYGKTSILMYLLIWLIIVVEGFTGLPSRYFRAVFHVGKMSL